MAPFRPTNINKRLYPGNGNIIGPTNIPTVGFTTTTCCSSTNVCSACCLQNILGCRCTFCACPCCNVCCSCSCTVCTRTCSSGIWKSSEQSSSSIRGAWGPSTCSSGAATCLCCTSVGNTCLSAAIADCLGFFYCCGPSTNKFFVSPSCTQTGGVNWYSRGQAVSNANAQMGSLGWFVPDGGQLGSGSACRGYWDSFASSPGACDFWSDQPTTGSQAFALRRMQDGVAPQKHSGGVARAYRCTAS